MIAIQLDSEMLTALIGLAEQGTELDETFIITRFGEELGNKILKSYALGADSLKIIKLMQDDMGKVPADASEETKYLYSLELNIIKSYVDGTLEATVNRYQSVLPIMPTNVIGF